MWLLGTKQPHQQWLTVAGQRQLILEIRNKGFHLQYKNTVICPPPFLEENISTHILKRHEIALQVWYFKHLTWTLSTAFTKCRREELDFNAKSRWFKKEGHDRVGAVTPQEPFHYGRRLWWLLSSHDPPSHWPPEAAPTQKLREHNIRRKRQLLRSCLCSFSCTTQGWKSWKPLKATIRHTQGRQVGSFHLN